LGDNPAKPTQPDGETALHVATRHNQLDAARLLTANGADVNAVTRQQRTPLELALFFGAADLDLIRFLIENGAEIKVGSSIIRVLNRTDCKAIIEFLLENGFDVNTPIQKNGRTLLDSIVLRLEHPWDMDYEPMVTTLLRHGADVNLRGRPDGDPPLVLAAFQGCVGIARLLIAAGADPASGSPRIGTALHAAAKHGSSELVKLLLTAGADPLALNSDGESALELIRPYEETFELVERLVNR
jgi:ankyrin repeat protein